MARSGKAGSPDPSLPEWGSGSTPTKQAIKPSAPRKKRRWPRRMAILGVVVLVVLGVLIAMVPTIGSSLAPGIIEGAAKGQIAGSVKVSKVGLSWRGNQVIGPVELRDEKDKTVGSVSATIPVGLLTVITEQWWSKANIDIGQVEISGDLDVIVDAVGGTSNLDRAIAPGPLAKPATKSGGGGGGGGGGPDVISGVVRLKDLNVSYTDKAAAVGSPMAAGIGLLKFGGDVKFTFDQPGGANGTGSILAKTALSGLLKGGSAGKDKLELNADIDVKQSKSGALDSVKAIVEVFGAPLDLVDGLAGFKGELVKSLGDRAEVKLNTDGTAENRTATLVAKSDGMQADFSFKYADGVLSADKPGRVSIRRTDFIAGLPMLQAKFIELGKTVRLDAGPSLDINLTSFKLPVPKEMLGGGRSGGASAAPKFVELDLRSASVELSATIGSQAGSVALDTAQGGAGSRGESSATKMTPFMVEPFTITASAPTLGGAVSVTSGTKATLEGKPAGDLTIAATASGLLDEKGRLKPESLKDLRAQLGLKGTSTALLQPLAGMVNVPLDMAQDIGPTVDLAFSANSQALSAGRGGSGGPSIPPMDIAMTLTSRNINVDATLKIADTVQTVGNGVSLKIDSAGPLVRRVLAARDKSLPGAASSAGGSMEVAGRGKVDVSIKDLLLDMNVLMPKVAAGTPAQPLDIGALLQSSRAQADVRIEDLSITMIPAASNAGASKGLLAPERVSAAAPIVVSRASFSAMLKPGEQPRMTLDSGLSHEGAPFTVAASLSAPASVLVPNAVKPGAGANPVQQLIAYKPTVKADVKSLPRSITKVVPSLAGALDPGTGKDVAAEVKRLLADVLGDAVDVTIESAPGASETQTAKVDVRSTGGTAAVFDAVLSATQATLKQVELRANVTPGNTAGLFAALGAEPEAKPGEPAAAASGTPKVPMSLADPFTLRLAIDPYTLGLETPAAGGIAPQWEGAPDLTARLTTSAAVTLRNVSVSDSNVAASLRGLSVVATLPLAKIMGPSPAGALASTKVLGELLRTDSGRNDSVAKLDVDAQVPVGDGGNLSAVVKLNDVNTGAADAILGKPNYLVGALGERLQANVRVQQVALGGGTKDAPAAKRTDVQADLESSRLTGASIRASMDNEAIRADSAKLVWTPSVEWVNDNLFGAAEARKQNTQPGAALAKETTFTLDLKRLAIASTKKDGERTVQGPLKQGIFALEMLLTSPGMTLRRADGKTVQLDEIRAAVGSREAAGTIGFDVGIARVSGEGTEGAKPSRLFGTIEQLSGADGVLTTERAEITAEGGMESLPTALVDALANQKGTIVDALGAILNLYIKAQRLSAKGGTVELTTTAPRLDAKLLGKIENDTFIQTGPIEANITEIIEPLVKRFAGGVPLVENVIKTAQDEKGFIKAQNLTFPADGKDMTKFSGLITVDLGTAQFEAQGFFNQILKAAGGRRSGVVGRKIEPFNIRADKGVLTYDRFVFPLGEFTVETRGTVDLVNRRINVVTYVPLLALADETIGLLGTGGLFANLKVLDRNTLVPIKISGSMDNPKAQPDAETFLKENAAKLIPDPKKILEDPGKVLEDLLKGPKKDK